MCTQTCLLPIYMHMHTSKNVNVQTHSQAYTHSCTHRHAHIHEDTLSPVKVAAPSLLCIQEQDMVNEP